MIVPSVFVLSFAFAPAGDPALEAKVKEIFEESCTACHSGGGDPTDPGDFDLDLPLGQLVGTKSAANGKIMVAAGNPKGSYLLDKMYGTKGIAGELMPLGEDALPAEQLKVVEDWIRSLPSDGPVPVDDGPREPPKKKNPKPFHGTHQIVLPTTTTLGKRTFQYRIDHRFGRIGTERGAFGLDAGAIMSMGIAYGILDGWDVTVRRTTSRKGWEFGTKYVGLRQENDWPASLGAYAAFSFFNDFDVANRFSGDFMVMLSRLWFDRWSTMLTVSYHLRTNHNARPTVDFDDGAGDRLVEDKRDTLVLGIASTVWLGKKKKWGVDFEWLLPIPDGRSPNNFYYRGGDADSDGTRIGAWSIGGSYAIGYHFFQVFFTNNREINLNLAAPGGQTANPFRTENVESDNPFNEFNFFVGFNLGRRFKF